MVQIVANDHAKINAEYEKINGDRRSNRIHNPYSINLNKIHILRFHDACLYFHVEY